MSVEDIAERHYAGFPGRIPAHWAGPRDVRELLDELGVAPICMCKARGAEVVEFDGTPLVQHLKDCAWLEWTRRTGGCMGDPDPGEDG